MRARRTLPQGPGARMNLLTIDYEAYSEAGYIFDPALGRFIPLQKGKPGLKGINAAVYSEHPSTRVISMAYDDKLWVPGCGVPEDLFEYVRAGGLIEAHNSGFEYYIWKNVCTARMGWPPVPLEQFRCSMSKARAWGLPGALGPLGRALRSDEQKDTRGAQLIRLLCVPRKPTKSDPSLFRSREDHPELHREMYAYNRQDVKSERSVSARMPDLSPFELAVWQLDQRINTRGIQIDIPAVEDCISVFYQAQRQYEAELSELTGGAVRTVGEITKGSAGDKWLQTQGIMVDSLDKAAVKALLKRPTGKVVHCKREPYDVYIGRPSKWGNPFSIGKDGNRAEVMRKYEHWFIMQPELMAARGELEGKTLGCWCHPKACHGDILMKMADLMPVKAHRMLQIRQILGSSSVKKLFALQRTVSNDGRLRDMFIYCGAQRTGRWSGSGSQPQNLVNSGPDCLECGICGHIWATVEEDCPKCGTIIHGLTDLEWGDRAATAALATISTRDLPTVEAQWGNALDVVASCMRSVFIAAPVHDLICSDYAAIEAADLAALAGEEWRLEVFRTHGKIYETSASKVSGVPLDEILEHRERTKKHHPLRKLGKVAELASGFAGWIGAWKNFGADKFMTDDEIKKNVLAWRADSPAIVEFWGGQWRKEPGRWKFTLELYGLEGAAIQALQTPGTCFAYRSITYGYDTRDDALYCLLPSGRRLAYHEPRLTRGVDPRRLDVWRISYMGWNSNHLKGKIGWIRMETYGGKLAENVTQAVARDQLAAAMLRVESAGYRIVLHVHDEIIAEVPHGFGSVEEFEKLMMVREPWFADWPIKAAGGWRGKRYRK